MQFFYCELSYNCSSFESLTLKFGNTPIGNITIATIYRLTDNNTKIIEQFNEDFHQYLTTFCQSHNNSIICTGDFNIDLLKYTYHPGTFTYINNLFTDNMYHR